MHYQDAPLNLFHDLGLSSSKNLLDRARSQTQVVLFSSTQSLLRFGQNLGAWSLKDSPALFSISQTRANPYRAQRTPRAYFTQLLTLQTHWLATDLPSVVLVNAGALLERWPDDEHVFDTIQDFKVGTDLDRDRTIANLNASGYLRVNRVEAPGSYATRGSILDIFWPGAFSPVRIDLFGDTIESLRSFDVDSGRSLRELKECFVGPVALQDASSNRVQECIELMRDLGDHYEIPTKVVQDRIRSLEESDYTFKHELYTPLLYPHQNSFFQALNTHRANAKVWLAEHIDLEKLARDTQDQWIKAHAESCRSKELVFPVKRYLSDDDTLARELGDLQRQGEKAQQKLPSSECQTLVAELSEGVRLDVYHRESRSESVKELYTAFLKCVDRIKARGSNLLLLADSPSQEKRMLTILKESHTAFRLLSAEATLQDVLTEQDTNPFHTWCNDPSVSVFVKRVKNSWSSAGLFDSDSLFVVPLSLIFGSQTRRKRKSTRASFSTSLEELTPGEAVVHIDHGVGIFNQLVRLRHGAQEEDYLEILYQDDDKLFLPVQRINLIQRYKQPGSNAPRRDKLGSNKWATTKKKVKKGLASMAGELLKLYAARELATRPASSKPGPIFDDFCAKFPFEATEDQERAVEDIIQDMTSESPMDRLVCGDVGYGKTEVAMRAAMVALLAGKQVCVLAPTTVLAHQHVLRFQARFEGFPVKIRGLSRLQKGKAGLEVLEALREGTCDMVIGTHRLLSPDVEFKNLGLIIVDEEQRFGVKAKEHLKRLRSSVDILTLSATPIPRTMQMSFLGLRDLSVIESAPVDRQAIRTELMAFEDNAIKELSERELERGGQVYFIHNRVRSIETVASHLRNLLPGASVEVAHGQMPATQLEEVMLRFVDGSCQVLVCSTIVENGIDVSRANTMFIHHPEDFGLSQLYQLRGRIGRSSQRAFAYLLLQGSLSTLSAEAQKRLKVLRQFSELGAGFKIAQHDLELRGAGDLLGKSQHGHATAVGYDLYASLLKECVEELRGRDLEESFDPEVKMPCDAFLPDHYVKDLGERLLWYQKLAMIEDPFEIEDILEEVADQNGPLPDEVRALGQLMTIKCISKKLRVRALTIAHPKGEIPAAQTSSHDLRAVSAPVITLTLGDGSPLGAAKVVHTLAAHPTLYRLVPPNRLQLLADQKKWHDAHRNYSKYFESILTKLQAPS